MNEKRWRSSRTPTAMLEHLQAVQADERKVRLYICACWRERAHLISDPAGMWQDIAAVEEDRYRGRKQEFFPTYKGFWYAAKATSEVHARWARNKPVEPGVSAARQAGFLRDLFGNPFRPVAFNSDWRTDTVVALARQVYGAYEFGAMPILADALQDAGCDSDDILNHCRSDGPHVRGCWVCDLVLVKE